MADATHEQHPPPPHNAAPGPDPGGPDGGVSAAAPIAKLTWHRVGQGVVSDFLNPHFVLTIFIVIIWALAIRPPIGAVSDGLAKLTGAADDATEMTAILNLAKDSIAAISGVFTTLLGLVLGHYFGQRGEQARAQKAEQDAAVTKADAQMLGGQAKKQIEQLLSAVRTETAEAKQLREAMGVLVAEMPSEQLTTLSPDLLAALEAMGMIQATPANGQPTPTEPDPTIDPDPSATNEN